MREEDVEISAVGGLPLSPSLPTQQQVDQPCMCEWRCITHALQQDTCTLAKCVTGTVQQQLKCEALRRYTTRALVSALDEVDEGH